MSKLDDALKRFEQVATLGMRESDYKQVDDSLAWFREDLAVVKNALSKKDELLKQYKSFFGKTIKFMLSDSDERNHHEALLEIAKLEKEIEEELRND